MSKSLTFLLFLILFSSYSSQVNAQCSPAAPAQGACSGGNGAAFDGVNINNGQTYWYSSSGTFSNGSNINTGGVLRVCGNLTLNQINLNGGTIIVAAGGTLTINGSGTLNLNNNVTIVNYGTLNINRDVVFQNSGNAIINATTSAVINMSSYKMTVSGSNTSSGNILINKGSIFLNTLEITGNSNGVCMGDQSVIETKTYVNTKTNAISVEPGAIAVLRVTVSGQNNAALSGTPNLHICKASGAGFSGSSNVGSAIVYENCTAAASVLPVTLKSFQAKAMESTVLLTWETERELNNDYFIVEHSTDGIDFEAVSEQIQGAGNSDHSNRYTWTDRTPAAGINYYRLKQTDTDGKAQYHGIRSANISQGIVAATVFPNPANQSVTVNVPGNEHISSDIVVTDMTGRQVLSATAEDGRQNILLDLSILAPGNYILTISNDTQTQAVKLVKQ